MEIHLTPESTTFLNTAYSKNLSIVNSPDPENLGGKGGLAIVINERLVKTEKVDTTIIIPGQALLVQIKGQEKEPLLMLGVYAPTESTANQDFWTALKRKLEQLHLPQLHILLGDINLVGDSIDRDPAHPDNELNVIALRDLLETNTLVDGWRSMNPTEIAYTYVQDHRKGKARSRIDHIYITHEILDNESDNWTIQDTAVKTDHKRISVELRDVSKPKMGRGRSTIQPFLIDNKRYMQEVNTLAKKTLSHITTHPAETQTAFQEFKSAILASGRAAAKKLVPILKTQVETLQQKRTEIDNNPNLTQHERSIQIEFIERNISIKLRTMSRRQQNFTTTKYNIARDRGSKEWYRLKEDSMPRDNFQELYVPNSTENKTTTDSETIAAIAAQYHEQLQSNDRPNRTDIDVKKAEEEAISAAKSRISEEEKAAPEIEITEQEIEAAILTAKSNTAPGLDGIPVELWKKLHVNHKKDADTGADIVQLLTKVFNDIERNGPHPEGRFSEGWMCPILKKKDRKDIANYRPITLLNTGYKLLTKALATQVQMVAPKLLHMDQAGFMKGRSILDQVRTLNIIIPYTEKVSLNGIIVGLDQEKVYDKINHTYIWRTLENANFPEHFTQTVKYLYTNAYTSVMINGFLSAPYLITRGAQQGDPLSCLLFNIAIEPLACMIREHPELRGLEIPGTAENLIVSLFADSTTVFLSKIDNFQALERTLQKWCLASGAKFNISKTEVIPIGCPEHRKRVSEQRKLNSTNDNEILERIHIAKDRETVCLLGGYIGNQIETQQIWSTQLSKLKDDLKQWGKRNLSHKEKNVLYKLLEAEELSTKKQGKGSQKK